MAAIGKLIIVKGEGEGLFCDIKEGEEVSIGRNLGCSIPVPDIKLSRIHCVVRSLNGVFEVLDNNSTNGTYLNGKKIELCQNLCSQDIITVGDTDIQFICEEV